MSTVSKPKHAQTAIGPTRQLWSSKWTCFTPRQKKKTCLEQDNACLLEYFKSRIREFVFEHPSWSLFVCMCGLNSEQCLGRLELLVRCNSNSWILQACSDISTGNLLQLPFWFWLVVLCFSVCWDGYCFCCIVKCYHCEKERDALSICDHTERDALSVDAWLGSNLVANFVVARPGHPPGRARWRGAVS